MPRRLLRPSKRYGHWQVLVEAPRTENGKRAFLCRCACGTERVLRFDNLRSRLTRSCGCQGTQQAVTAEARYRRHLSLCALASADVLLATPWPSTQSYARVLKQLAATSQLAVHGLLSARYQHPQKALPTVGTIRQAIADAREVLVNPAALTEEGRLL
jgi:hypothetical protein